MKKINLETNKSLTLADGPDDGQTGRKFSVAVEADEASDASDTGKTGKAGKAGKVAEVAATAVTTTAADAAVGAEGADREGDEPEKKSVRARVRERAQTEGKDLVQTLLHPDAQEAPEELRLDETSNLKRSKLFNTILNISTVVLIAAMLVATFIGYRQGIFKSQETLTSFVNGLGPAAPFIFVLIQIVQVVIPILPGAIGCAVGVIAFGPIWGLIYNYVGICIGSMLAFLLARHYGKPFVIKMIGEKAYNKYIGWTANDKKYETIFAILIFLPVAPDDLLCYISGITNMTFKKFTAIILLCKPFSISLYSLGLTFAMTSFWHWLVGLGG